MVRRTLFILTGILCLSMLLLGNSEAAPSTGTIQVAFILSEFEDQEYQEDHDQDYFEDLAFGNSDSMWEYYDEVSRSELNIEGDVFGPYTLDGDAADYGTENMDFVEDSVEIADDDIDYRNYDAVMVIHSGPGEESSGNSDDIWSIHWPYSIETDDDGHEIEEITQAPEYEYSSGERSPLGVWVHEFGHELGIPDLYDTDDSSEGIGHWGVMASGSWADNGETPVYFSAWSRYWLGWIDPIVITDDINNLELEPIENEGNVYLLPIPGNWSNSNEYYLIENRQKLKYDSYLPGEGLLIWHIDEEVIYSNWNSNSVNNDEDHKGVDLEEADGEDDLDHTNNRGDSGDPYNSGSFTKNTYPNSLAYNGTESGWKIENIETSGDNIIVDISFLSKPHAVADADEAVIAEGLELQFYGDESWDEDGNIVSYTWDFGDGDFSYTDNPTHIFTQNGTYDVKLTVCDNNDLCDSMILNIFVNKPPIAVVEISKLTIMLGETITFDASGSYDIDGDVDFYYWNFDDGYTSSQASADHEYRNSGTYNVSLKIIDDLNDITTVYYTIEVINRLPIVDFYFEGGNRTATQIFQFYDSSYDEDGEIIEWLWDFGEGNTSDAHGNYAEKVFWFPGTYNVTLFVTDDQLGINSTTIEITVTPTLPQPQIRIPDGLRLLPLTMSNFKTWYIPAERLILLDASPTWACCIWKEDRADVEYFWTIEEETYFGKTVQYNFGQEETSIQLRVVDSWGNEKTRTFTVVPQTVPLITIENWEDYIEIAVGYNMTFQTISEGGTFDLYRWYIQERKLDDDYLLIDDINTNDSLQFPVFSEGEYLVKVSGRHTETKLWAENFSMTIFIYENPTAKFYFNEAINEGNWVTFDASTSSGFWNGSESRVAQSLNLNYEWALDGKTLAGNDKIITVLMETGGEHRIDLLVSQEPVGSQIFSTTFYADYKPWGVLSTHPSNPRYGEDFEVYLNAYDVESEAVIEFLEITVYDYEGNQRAGLIYENQGANFNIIFEIEYTGTIVLEYGLRDGNNNYRENSSNIDVLGWVDIYVDSLDIKGTKEKGKKQIVDFVLTNYNETYQKTIYNGQIAIGTVDLLIDGEIVNTWSYNINPTESEQFSFDWVAIPGIHDFEVIAYVSDGEIIEDNNNLTASTSIKSERGTGLLPYPNIIIVIISILIATKTVRRKAN
ncbi:MAG: M6 family metalloprotease domain-containing protein [Candidatus Poseidoniia archaeon]